MMWVRLAIRRTSLMHRASDGVPVCSQETSVHFLQEKQLQTAAKPSIQSLAEPNLKNLSLCSGPHREPLQHIIQWAAHFHPENLFHPSQDWSLDLQYVANHRPGQQNGEALCSLKPTGVSVCPGWRRLPNQWFPTEVYESMYSARISLEPCKASSFHDQLKIRKISLVKWGYVPFFYCYVSMVHKTHRKIANRGFTWWNRRCWQNVVRQQDEGTIKLLQYCKLPSLPSDLWLLDGLIIPPTSPIKEP